MKKEFLRKKYKEKRDNIKNKVTKDNLIYQKVINNKDILSSKTLLIYISINSEVDTIKIINYFLYAKNIAVPKIIDNDMFFCYVTNLNDLTPGKYNIPEPTNENIVTDFDNAICIVPGICYDKENYRIGYGKGYYDRFLSKNKIKTIGLCYKECMIEKIDNDKYDYNITNNRTIPYLKSKGIKKIDNLILTHGDYDHMGEAINIVNNFKVEKVIFNCGKFNDLEKELIKVLNKRKIKYYSCINELNIDNNKLYFLQTKEYDNENDNSNVIYTKISGYKFMFMGDAGVDKEKDILENYNISNIDVLKVGHHGSKTSSSKKFIDEINPKYGVISVGKNNKYGHPNKEVLNNLSDSKIYRTDEDGSILFKIKNNKLKIKTCSP